MYETRNDWLGKSIIALVCGVCTGLVICFFAMLANHYHIERMAHISNGEIFVPQGTWVSVDPKIKIENRPNFEGVNP